MKTLSAYSPWLLIAVFIFTAVIMFTFEVIKHFLFEGRLTATESHAITIIMTSAVATLAAAVMRTCLISVNIKEKEIGVKQKSLEHFTLVLSAVNHIVNNVLNYFQLIRVEMDNDGKINNDTLKLLEESVNEANLQMKLLNKIHDPQDPQSYTGIYPSTNDKH